MAEFGGEHRVAVALNNIGVDLLERRCYEQALVTLMDGTTAMKSALRKRDGEAIDIPGMLERASKRRSKPVPMERKASFRMLNLSDHHSHFTETSPSFSREGDSIYPIRIDDVASDLRCPGSLDDPDAQAAILIHNLGLTNLCLARVNQNNEQLSQAVGLFQLSHSILEKFNSSCNDSDEWTWRQSTCLNMAVVSSLVQAGCLDWLSRLSDLQSMVEELDELLPFVVVHTAGAA